jgi:DNA alkylation repair enzyme
MRGNLRTLEHHRALLAGLKAHRRNRVHSQANDSYVGSGHIYYDVSVPVRRTLAKNWLKENRGIEDAEFLAVVGSLFGGESHEEKTLASILLASHPSGRKAVGPKQLNAWLDELVGWAEIDHFHSGGGSCESARMGAIYRGTRASEEHQQAPRSVGVPDRAASPLGRQETCRAGVQNDRGAQVGTGDNYYQGRFLAAPQHGRAQQASGRRLHQRKSTLASRDCSPRDEPEDRDRTKMTRPRESVATP